MYTCANCNILACASGDKTRMPANCPMRRGAWMRELLETYRLPENHDFYVRSSAIEAAGYCQWPRLKET